VTAYPAWTPASRPGIIPLHPLTFGTILGRSFVALRQNPRVLLGFALVVQTLAYLLLIVAVAGVAALTFSRLDTVPVGSDEFETIMAGSIAITVITGIVLGLAVGALSVIVQAIVVNEVAHAAVAEKLSLGGLWQGVKPVFWRLFGYSFLLALALIVAFGVVGLGVFGLSTVAAPAAIGLVILLVLAAIPLIWWLSIKLLLVPSAIILEHATIRQAIARSWRLVRGRFWVALGVIFLISITFSAVGQVISIPFSFLSTGLTTIVAPTGDPDVSAIIATLVALVLTYVVALLIQAVALVVQSTASALIYIDCRMRHEGLDLDLLAYVEKRDAGITPLPDPYREHVGREIAPRATGAYAPGAYPPSAYPQPGYPPQPYVQPVYPQPQYTPQPPQSGYAPQPYPQQAGPQPTPPAYQAAQPAVAGQPTLPPPPGYRVAPPPTARAAPAAPAEPTAAPAALTPDADAPPPTRWAAPGASPDADRESPWR
jgi:hypothetical protein